MTNKQANSVGVASMILFVIFMIAITTLLSSCGSMRLTNAEQLHRAKIDKEINILWTEYTYKVDSLMVEYYKKDHK